MANGHLASAPAAAIPEEYVRLAVRLANDPQRRAEWRGGLRRQMLQSALCDAVGFTQGLEAAYRQVWRDWCKVCAAAPQRVGLARSLAAARDAFQTRLVKSGSPGQFPNRGPPRSGQGDFRRVEHWRAYGRVRWQLHAFRPWASVNGSLGHVSSRPP
jgi:hypothetical protein